jgi:hypothetical protein
MLAVFALLAGVSFYFAIDMAGVDMGDVNLA